MDGVFEVNTSDKMVYTGLVRCTGYTYHFSLIGDNILAKY